MVDHPPSRKHRLSTCPQIVPSIVSVSHVTRVTRDMMCPRDSVTTFCLTSLHMWGLYSYKPARQNISLAISSVLAITSDHNTITRASLEVMFRNFCSHLAQHIRTVTVSWHLLGKALVPVVVTQCCHDYSLLDLSELSEPQSGESLVSPCLLCNNC